ncbi:hypothetical protein [Mesorhizobium sp.]|uniref:hypothetical protein n=1 Tax=Mesorhizobium sp. TaxID=1871066 RepID=UPI001207778F|nr:hypothetical protein [Mesorhizobium sp.]TIL65679.1 MAG: hypothetical protein E5Y77_21120 [Mesorhizobium sp.]
MHEGLGNTFGLPRAARNAFGKGRDHRANGSRTDGSGGESARRFVLKYLSEVGESRCAQSDSSARSSALCSAVSLNGLNRQPAWLGFMAPFMPTLPLVVTRTAFCRQLLRDLQ